LIYRAGLVRSGISSFATALLVGLLGLTGPRAAWAANNDEEALALVESVFASEFVEGKYAEALEKLQLAATVCAEGCSPSVRAKVYIGIGTLFATGLSRPDDAKEAFRLALKEDPAATLLKGFDSDEAKKAFEAAKGAKKPAGKPKKAPPKAAAALPTKTCAGSGRPPRGWRDAGAYDCYQQALEAEEKRDWIECAAWSMGSVAVEDRSTSRFLAASCLERGGRWLEALAQYEKVAAAGTGASGKGQERAEGLRGKIPKITIRPPARVQDLVVRIDGSDVPAGQIRGENWVDPGDHVVSATGKIAGEELEFEQSVNVGEFETASVEVKLVPKGSAITDSTIMKCMTAAKTREDFAKCIGDGPAGSELNVLVGTEISAYTDDDAVSVVTPGVFGTISNPTDGWTLGGAFLVDVVTAASADIVATASPRWTETRYVPSLNGSKKWGDFTAAARTNASIEPDYLALGAGLTASVDLAEKTVTPSLGYDFGFDVSGRAGTSYGTYANIIHRHGIDGSFSFVLDKATVLTLGLTAVLEFGDTSKPYRFVPMFEGDIAAQVPAGLQAVAVDTARNPERVIEQLPTERQRYALAGRIAHRFSSSTIRIEERLYADTWGIKATTTDGRYVVDVDQSWRVWPHFRGHLQSAVNFWQLAYTSTRTPQGLQVPELRTGDRELGPMLGLSAGGGIRYAFGEEKNWALTLSGDAVYTRFLDHLYILERLGVFGALAAEAEFD
jgi:hypothetical protein